jgi:hypothetical protein
MNSSSNLATGGRWMVTFVGYPIGGLTAKLLVGPVNSVTAAILGGLVTGAILGTAQAWGLGHNRPPYEQWIAATAIGVAVGLAVGSFAVGYSSSAESLVLQGAITGLTVGAAQAAVLRPKLGRIVVAWPFALSAIMALGWAITTAVGVQVEEQFTIFGASGAITVTALTLVLPFVLKSRPPQSTQPAVQAHSFEGSAS